MLIAKSLLLIAGAANAFAATYVAQFSPTFPNLPTPTGAVTSFPTGGYETSDTLGSKSLSGFPAGYSIPSTTSSEVKAAYNSINWDKVPKAPVRPKKSNGDISFSGYSASDPHCWWSYSLCVTPKVSYLPPDISTCPHKGDWGLNYDDGPLHPDDSDDAKYAEPALYNFLAKEDRRSTLFYVGSNVVAFPEAAKRALNNGHEICSHTWSHNPMTTLTNAQIVAELYWSIKAIKAATGVTTKCWRPPQGDVDDRVRAIAYQMGLTTILWDLDTNDWDIGYGTTAKTVDKNFQTWIDNYKSGKDTDGHIVLEHELSKATVNMSMHWLPKIKKVFNVVPILTCNDINKPYWEENFVYPGRLASGPTTTTKAATTTTKKSTTTKKATTKKTTTKKTTTKKTTTKKPTTTKKTTTKKTTTKKPTTKKTTTKKTTTKKTTTKKTTTKKNTTKKTTTKKSCLAGVSGKKNGSGNTGYCCTSSDDCLETCRNGVCGL